MRENKLEYRDQAIGEALHWWVRDEFYLYNLFSNLDESLDVMDISFFSELVFGTFLKQYSVRRTIKGGKTEEKNFLLEIKEKGYESFINGEVGNVDELKIALIHQLDLSNLHSPNLQLYAIRLSL